MLITDMPTHATSGSADAVPILPRADSSGHSEYPGHHTFHADYVMRQQQDPVCLPPSPYGVPYGPPATLQDQHSPVTRHGHYARQGELYRSHTSSYLQDPRPQPLPKRYPYTPVPDYQQPSPPMSQSASHQGNSPSWGMLSPISATTTLGERASDGPHGGTYGSRSRARGSWDSSCDPAATPSPGITASRQPSIPYVKTGSPTPTARDSAEPTHPAKTEKVEQLKISNLISADLEPAPDPTALPCIRQYDPHKPSQDPPNPYPLREYNLRMRQQPMAARACGLGQCDRRFVDPPPILDLRITDPAASEDVIDKALDQVGWVLHCSLRAEDGVRSRSQMPTEYTHCRAQAQSRLVGCMAVSPIVCNDENGVRGCFFSFGDLSVRTPGRYTLFFQLILVVAGRHAPVLATAISDVFTVYNAKEFPGMQKTTPLALALKSHGCVLGLKKGFEGKNPRCRSGSDDDDEVVEPEPKKKRKSVKG